MWIHFWNLDMKGAVSLTHHESRGHKKVIETNVFKVKQRKSVRVGRWELAETVKDFMAP